MKRFLSLLFIVIAGMPYLYGQVRGYKKEKLWLDANLRTGTLRQQFTTVPLYANYNSYLNPYQGNMKFTSTGSLGYNLQFGYYFGNSGRFGVGVGLLYFSQQGAFSVDTFHVEYKSSDYNGNVFRQSISANKGMRETISSKNLSIPLMLRFRQKLTDIISLSLDAGIVYNVHAGNAYKATASFDYEAIYQIDGTGTNLTFNYDRDPVPRQDDWLITRKEFMKDNPTGNIQQYFDGLNKTGFNVGLNKPITNRTGQINYRNSSIGFIAQGALNFKLSDRTLLNFGGYYMQQNLENPANTRRIIVTDKPGEYTSLLRFTKDITANSYGVYVGLTFRFYQYTAFIDDMSSQIK